MYDIKMEEIDFLKLSLAEEKVSKAVIQLELFKKELMIAQTLLNAKYTENGKYTLKGIDPNTRMISREFIEPLKPIENPDEE